MNSRASLTKKQIELIEKVKGIAEQIGQTPTLAMLDENPEWPGRGAVRYYFGSYKELLELAELPRSRCIKRYKTKELRNLLRDYIITLGRVPTQAEVRNDLRMPSDETILNVYSTWEEAVMAAGFTMNWCKPELKKKLLLDLKQKYVEMGHRLPGPQDIQNDPRMEKVHVYIQVFGDFDCAREMAGIKTDYHKRQKQEIIATILRLQAELGRTPKIRDEGMPNSKLIGKIFGSYEEALAAAGLKPNRRYYSKKRLVKQLRKKAVKLGRSPRAMEIMADPTMASMQTFRKVFGSYEKALRAAKLPPAPAGKGHCYTVKGLTEQLQVKYTRLGRVPTTRDVNEDREMASANVFKRMFGSFKLALEAAGIPTKRTRAKYARQELIAQMRQKTEELGRPPKQKEVEVDPEMASVHTFVDEFGSFIMAIEAAGFKASRKREYNDAELLDDLEQKYIAIGYLKTGRRPTNKEINADPAMASTRAYDLHFGTTNRARKLVEQRLLKEVRTL